MEALPQDIPSVSNYLVNLIQLTLEPMVSHEQRLDAYKKFEDFKDNSPLCAQCGLYLVQCSEYSHIVRHTGIQLMEHCIKYRWYNLTQEEKLFIKESCISLLNNGNTPMIDLFRTHKHTTDALARIFVEMIKREWPQHWPNMFSELSTLCEQGPVQTELVLFIFLRLSEDVVSLQTLESQTRRKDLCQCLNNNMKDIVHFFFVLLEKYLTVSSTSANFDIVRLALTTMTEYFEWIALSNILETESLISRLLFEMINLESYQVQVVDCLERIVSRRGKLEEKMALFRLFTSSATFFPNLHQCVVQYHSKGVLTKHIVEFYKIVSTFMKSYIQLLCSCYESCTVQLSAMFSSQLDILLILFQTKCLSILDNVYSAFAAMFRHPQLRKTTELLSVMEKYILITCRSNLVKKKTDLSDNNIQLLTDDNFMDDMEYRRNFSKIKTLILINFKELTRIVPDMLFSYGENWLMTCVANNVTDASEWEALTTYLESSLGHLIRPMYASNSLSLISVLLNFSTPDAIIYSSALSCLSTLFNFFTLYADNIKADYVPKVLDKIFSLLLFTSPNTEDDQKRLKSVISLRKHAASLIVKLSMRYPHLLMPYFDVILNVLLSYNSQLNHLQINCLYEALININNNTNSFVKQMNFVRSLLQVNNYSELWISWTYNVFASVETFVEFIGLNKDLPACISTGDGKENKSGVVSTGAERDMYISNRTQIVACVNLILSVMRRCRVPMKNGELIRQGGYLIDGRIVNPAANPVLPLLPGVLKLVTIIQQLHNKDHVIKHNLVHSDYLVCFEVDEVEKKNLLGEQYFSKSSHIEDYSSDIVAEKSPLLHMQTFFITLCENLFLILGNATKVLAYEVYNVPEFSAALNANLFNNVHSLPNHRVRYIVRHFVRSYVIQCPESRWDDVLIPFMNYFTTHMYQRINAKWETLAESCRNETEEREEAVDEVILVVLQREYMDVVRDLLMHSNASSNGAAYEDTMNIEAPSPNRIEVLTSLGIKIIRNKPTCDAILMFLIRCLSYNDTQCSLKTGRYLLPILIQIVNDSLVNDEIVRLLFMNLLQAIHVHGEHDANMGALIILCVQCYTLLRPQFELCKQMLLLIPNINILDVNKFDEKILSHCVTYKNSPVNDVINNKSEKAFKEMFKKLVTNIIGKNIGQLFKCKATIKELPRLVSSQNGKHKDQTADDNVINDIAHLFN